MSCPATTTGRWVSTCPPGDGRFWARHAGSVSAEFWWIEKDPDRYAPGHRHGVEWWSVPIETPGSDSAAESEAARLRAELDSLREFAADCECDGHVELSAAGCAQCIPCLVKAGPRTLSAELSALRSSAGALEELEKWLRVWHTRRIQDALSLAPLGSPERPLQVTLCERWDDARRTDLKGQWTGHGPTLSAALLSALEKARSGS